MKDGRQAEVCGLPGLPLIYGTDTTRKEQKGCLHPMSFLIVDMRLISSRRSG